MVHIYLILLVAFVGVMVEALLQHTTTLRTHLPKVETWRNGADGLFPLPSLSASSSYRHLIHPKSLTVMKMTEAVADEENEDDDSSNEKKLIEVSSELELPFSAEIAYDVYSDLERQPSWTSWLNSVEYVDDSKKLTKWKIKMLGLSYSWTAIAVANERPHTIKWKSTSGLQNFGTVTFLPSSNDDDNEGEDSDKKTTMTLSISFVTPRAVSALFRRSNKLTSVVRDKMLASSLVDFRDLVVEEYERL